MSWDDRRRRFVESEAAMVSGATTIWERVREGERRDGERGSWVRDLILGSGGRGEERAGNGIEFWVWIWFGFGLGLGRVRI